MKYYIICCSILLLFLGACNNRNHSLIQNERTTSKSLNLDSNINKLNFGSCNKEWLDQSYWKVIQKSNADLWIWLGDIIYADTKDMSALKNRYDGLKNDLYYKEFRMNIPVIGIWDDHDYGVNDGGKEYERKKESRDLLFDFLDVPKTNLAWEREGAYQSYNIGSKNNQIKIILLDARYFRDELRKKRDGPERYYINKDGGILGKKQWLWLEAELLHSEAKLNIIISGIQFLQEEQYFEKWANFPKERERLLRLLAMESTGNVLLISGDRHISELAKIKTENGKEIYEITSSGLTHSYEKNNEPNQYRLSPVIGEKSYGELQFNWNNNRLELMLNFNDMSGKSIYETKWDYNILKH